MSVTAELWLGVIAVAVVIMALAQIGVIVAGFRVARRVERLAADFESGVKPIIANLTALSSDASRATTLAVAQIDRFDRVFTDLTSSVDRTMSAAQQLLRGPARDGVAIMAAVRAAVKAFQSGRDLTRRRAAARRASHEDEEDSLFIG